MSPGAGSWPPGSAGCEACEARPGALAGTSCGYNSPARSPEPDSGTLRKPLGTLTSPNGRVPKPGPSPPRRRQTGLRVSRLASVAGVTGSKWCRRFPAPCILRRSPRSILPEPLFAHPGRSGSLVAGSMLEAFRVRLSLMIPTSTWNGRARSRFGGPGPSMTLPLPHPLPALAIRRQETPAAGASRRSRRDPR